VSAWHQEFTPLSSVLEDSGSGVASRTESARHHLLARIRRRYDTVDEAVKVGPLTLPFTRIADPNRVLDEVAAEEDRLERVSGQRASEDQLHLPYWAELWDSALGVGTHFVTQHSAFNSENAAVSVLDLGCGMGLAGTAAAAAGARVVFGDLEPPALLFAQINSLPYADRVRARRIDWRTDQLGERFDVILGSDILYERKQWDFLEPFWRAHLAPAGVVLLGEPGRHTGELFVNWIATRGWNLAEFAQPVATRSKPIRIFQLMLIAQKNDASRPGRVE
jgi:predicted nicotinamide N-methyase